MPIPPLFYLPFDTLPSLIQSTFKSAVEKEQISVFSAESSSVHHGVGAFDHTIFVVPELSDKPPAPHSTPDLSKKPDKDPFDGPSFEEGQSIADIGEHYLLTNSNAMREGEPPDCRLPRSRAQLIIAELVEHFMMITKGAFRAQAGTLEEKDLSAAYAIVTAYTRQGRPLLCFFKSVFPALLLSLSLSDFCISIVVDRMLGRVSPIFTFNSSLSWTVTLLAPRNSPKKSVLHCPRVNLRSCPLHTSITPCVCLLRLLHRSSTSLTKPYCRCSAPASNPSPTLKSRPIRIETSKKISETATTYF